MSSYSNVVKQAYSDAEQSKYPEKNLRVNPYEY